MPCHSQALQNEFQSQQQVLEKINATGTSLITGCQDQLSRDSVKESLSDLNDQWGDSLSSLDSHGERLREGMVMAESYERKEREFDGWLGVCEKRVAQPVDMSGDASSLQEKLRALEVGLCTCAYAGLV